MQRGVAFAVHGGAGARGWALRGTPEPTGTRNKTAGRPRGSTASFLVTVNGKSTPNGLGVRPIPLAARASTKCAKTHKVSETAKAGEGGGEKLWGSAIWQGNARVAEIGVVAGMDERLHAQVPAGLARRRG